MPQSLDEIAKRYGESAYFGHKDYAIARQEGYSDQQILDWLNQDLNRLSSGNKPGGPNGLYDEIAAGSVDYAKASNIDKNLTSQGGSQGMTGFEYEYQKSIDLANINKDIQNMVSQASKYVADVQAKSAVDVANISAGAATGVANINAGATKYTADRQKEATTYVADREKETALGVEDIRAQGALNLQDIVNAGLKDVETIRGESARDVARIGGEFDIEGEKIKGQTARDVARIDKEKGIYGSLISAFSF